MGRRIQVQQHDVLCITRFEIDAEILAAVLDPKNRCLWAFVHAEGGAKVQPTPFDESRVLWLEDSDLSRSSKDEPQWTGQTKPVAPKKRKVSTR